MLYILLVSILINGQVTFLQSRSPLPFAECVNEAEHLRSNAAVGGYTLSAKCVPVDSK